MNVLGEREREAVASVLASLEQDVNVTLELGPAAAPVTLLAAGGDELRDLAGTVVLVGVPTPDMKVPDLPLIDVFGRGGSLKSSWYGDCLPDRDFPMLVDLYQQGRLDLDAFVSERIGLDDIEAAFEKMHHGDVLRSVVIF